MTAAWTKDLTVVDFFSCGGGTSAGFSRRGGFKIVGAVDLELAKPSGGRGASDCNATYQTNHGIAPANRDMMELTPEEFAGIVWIEPGRLNVMISCAPCTVLSRAKPANHLVDSGKNNLVGRSGDFVEKLLPEVMFMENARELAQHLFAGVMALLQDVGEVLGRHAGADRECLAGAGLDACGWQHAEQLAVVEGVVHRHQTPRTDECDNSRERISGKYLRPAAG